jgi:hypothetical protein
VSTLKKDAEYSSEIFVLIYTASISENHNLNIKKPEKLSSCSWPFDNVYSSLSYTASNGRKTVNNGMEMTWEGKRQGLLYGKMTQLNFYCRIFSIS